MGTVPGVLSYHRFPLFRDSGFYKICTEVQKAGKENPVNEQAASEKKVEYVELIYDLIFVYIIGRNNQLLDSFENGFVALPAFITYVLTTLAIIQIWNYTTYYINIYGKHGVRDHVFMFINMFLLYFVGEGTRTDWQRFHTQYHVAWALIIVNIGAQYLLEQKNLDSPGRKHVRTMAAILFAEALIVMADIPLFQLTGKTWTSPCAILFGMITVIFLGQKDSGSYVDFPHLSERAMLYVVFTFGEMIIGIASYFEGAFTVRSTYFALMAFLIVVSLFLTYGIFYDHIIDREKKTNGLLYMLLHIFIIFAMNNITSGLELMQKEQIRLVPKMIFLLGSLLLFFGFLLGLGFGHAKSRCRQYNRLCLMAAVIAVVFIILMILFRYNMAVNIALTVVFTFSLFAMIYRYAR